MQQPHEHMQVSACWFPAFLIILFTCGCQALPEPNFAPDPPSLTVVSYNINWGGANAQRVVNYLAKTNADIVCLQETHAQWESRLKRTLSKHYPHASFGGSGGAGGIAILSRYPLSDIRYLPANKGWFPALLVNVDTRLGKVQVLNVHLRPPLSEKGTVTLSALYNSGKIHRQELNGFLKETNPAYPLIITGDFNEDENDSAIVQLLDQGYRDSLCQYDSSSPTWKWQVASGVTLSDRYDHIIYSAPLTCTGAKVTEVKASDHMPVLAVFVREMKMEAEKDE